MKIQKPVTFEQELDLSDFNLFETAKYSRYELFGVGVYRVNEL